MDNELKELLKKTDNFKHQRVLRKTLTGDWTEFSLTGHTFFVKNFSSSAIYVSFVDETDNDNYAAESIKINSNMGEEVSINSASPNSYVVNAIYVKGTGEVEVQVTGF